VKIDLDPQGNQRAKAEYDRAHAPLVAARDRFEQENPQRRKRWFRRLDAEAARVYKAVDDHAKTEPKPAPARVLTNEDITVGKETANRPVNTVGTGSKPEAKNPSSADKKSEAYWRGRAKQIRDEIDSVDKKIKALNEKTQTGKSDGIKIGFETYNSVIYADFESQVKELERQKEKLQKMMTALEEEARKSGALPGWLR
jgi:hypothetical protein